MSLLNKAERETLIRLLRKLQPIQSEVARSTLLRDLPPGMQQRIRVDVAVEEFIQNLVQLVESPTWEQRADGSWSVIGVLEAAADMVEGTQLAVELQTLRTTLNKRIGSEAMVKPIPVSAENTPPLATGESVLLNAEQRALLHDALLRAFPKKAALARMVWDVFDEDLAYLAGNTTTTIVAYNLIIWADYSGQIGELIKMVLIANPDEQQLQAIISAAVGTL